MSEGDYQIDGLVFTYNKLSLHDELGETAHHPRYKMAFKFQGESKITTIKEIVWSISRNGILTPVGEVEPVELSGAMIGRVTLHNFGLVKQFNLKKGKIFNAIFLTTGFLTLDKKVVRHKQIYYSLHK
jgi:DNA ligase (NAD+)